MSSKPSPDRHQKASGHGSVRVSNRARGEDESQTTPGMTLVRRVCAGQGSRGPVGLLAGWLGVLVFGVLLVIGCDADNNVKSREGALSGKVVNKSGTVLENVLVSWAEDRTRWGRSDAQGAFLVDGVEFGLRPFIAELSGYRPKTFEMNIYSEGITAVKEVIMETASFEYQDIKVTETSSTHAVVTWKTTDFTNGVIEYGDTETLGRTVRETAGQYATLHTLTIPDLKAEKRYYFKIVASRQNQPSETSAVNQFTTTSTLEDATPPVAPKGIAIALTETPNQVTIFWVPNTETDLKGYKIYRSELPTTGFTALEAFLAKGNERYVDVGVVTGKKYYYRVTAVDQGSNEGSASDIVQMVIPGDLTAQVQWTRANSPYVLYGDLTIAPYGTLRIDAGVVVKAGDYDALKRGDPTKCEMRVEGGLVANATGSDPIIFSSDRPTPKSGDWGGITIAPNAEDQPLEMVNVVIAYADKGLAITAYEGTMNQVSIHDCGIGVNASSVPDLLLQSFAIKHCQDGMLLTENASLTVRDSTIHHCRRGITSSANARVEYSGNNLFEYVDFGLKLNEQAGTLQVYNNLFVSGTGVGLQVIDQVVDVRNNTLDSPSGVRFDKGTPVLEHNFIFSSRSVSGVGIKGIEHLAGDDPAPVFGPNNVYGFPQGMDYVGCASAAGSLASAPYFMKDYGGGSYDYRLRFPFPDTDDSWGIQRTTEPLGL